jgi:hypothetical protein
MNCTLSNGLNDKERTVHVISAIILPTHIRELLPLFVAWELCTDFFSSSRLIPECEVKRGQSRFHPHASRTASRFSSFIHIVLYRLTVKFASHLPSRKVRHASCYNCKSGLRYLKGQVHIVCGVASATHSLSHTFHPMGNVV